MSRKGLITLSKTDKKTKRNKSTHPAKSGKSKIRIGFTGGLEKLQNIRNDIAVSEKPKTTTIGTSKISKIGRSKKSVPTIGGTRQKEVILRDPVLTVDVPSEIDEESSELVSDSENEDMTRFCKRMCKKTIESISNSVLTDELQKQKELKKFQKIRDKFVEMVLTDFRSKVKANVGAGKFILYQYDNQALYESYLIHDLLHKLDDDSSPADPSNQTGLRIISEKINPFRVLHYVHRVDPKPSNKEHRILEVTWAIPSKKNTKLIPNRLPEKYNRRWKITPQIQPILQATTITPEPPARSRSDIMAKRPISKNKNVIRSDDSDTEVSTI